MGRLYLWFVKISFPWLLSKAMKMGAKAFKAWRPQKHGWRSRQYIWDTKGRALLVRAQSTKNKLDDEAFNFAYANQSWCLCDGTAREKIGEIHHAITVDDKAAAIQGLASLKEMLGFGMDA